MKREWERFLCVLCSFLCLLCSFFAPLGKTQDQKQQDQQAKTQENGEKALGMSIVGNQEAPKALVIVPWKRSELGNARGISTMLDDSKQPIDKEVFMRMLSYYEIRSETTRPAGAPARTDAAQANSVAPSAGVGGPARTEDKRRKQ
jgi:hypothetical protein